MQRRSVLIALLITTVSIAPMASSQATIRLEISEVLAEPLGGREFIEIWNRGDPIDMENWVVEDAAGNQFVLPKWPLDHDERMVVWSGGNHDALGPAWSRTAVWNNGGDTAKLVDSTGQLHDQFSYPVTNVAPPSPGKAWMLDGGWTTGNPTPAQAPGGSGSGINNTISGSQPGVTSSGLVQATVANVAPHITNIIAPSLAKPGQNVQINFSILDANGILDIAGWNVTENGVQLASGTGPNATAQLMAPAGPAWQLVVGAWDQAGATVNVTINITVQTTPLSIVMPSGGVAFHEWVPGAQNVSTIEPFELSHLGSVPLVPKIDVSPMTGAVQIDLENNMLIGFERANQTTWIEYNSPLQALPQLMPGERAKIHLRVMQVPTPLPAGNYGTSFTVVA